MSLKCPRAGRLKAPRAERGTCAFSAALRPIGSYSVASRHIW
jgi:hypothetical protein